MSQVITVDAGRMREWSTKFAGQSENMEQMIKDMGNTLNEIKSEWTGAASLSFSNKYEEINPCFEQVKELMHQISQILNKSAQIYEDTDQSIASQIGM